MKRCLSSPHLKQEIARLGDLPRPVLVERWQGLSRTDTPKGISRTLLTRAVAYAMQVKSTRGLSPATRRKLRSIANGPPDVGSAAAARPRLRPGARLVREWNGTTHTVDVVDGGFVWNYNRYRSISAIARAITGTRWSGPLFFGLRKAAPPGTPADEC